MYNILLTGAVAEDLDIVGHSYCFPFFFWEQVFLRSLCEKYSLLFYWSEAVWLRKRS